MQVPPSRPPPTQTGRAGVVAPRLGRARPWRRPGCAARGPAAGRFSSRRGCAATTTGRERQTADARADCHRRTGVFLRRGGVGGLAGQVLPPMLAAGATTPAAAAAAVDRRACFRVPTVPSSAGRMAFGLLALSVALRRA